MVAVALISETVLDRNAFGRAAQQITQANHLSAVDAKPSTSRLVDDMRILKDFSGDENNNIDEALMNVGFLFAGISHEIEEVIEYTRGMPHMRSLLVPAHASAIVATGSIDHWWTAINNAVRADKLSIARKAFTDVYDVFCSKGLGNLFREFTTKQTSGGILLLELR